jgi:hypothetical protein
VLDVMAIIRKHDRHDLTVRQLYRRMRPSQLVQLQQAFILDAQETDSPICRQFCEERLALIASVLKEKAALKRKQDREVS